MCRALFLSLHIYEEVPASRLHTHCFFSLGWRSQCWTGPERTQRSAPSWPGGRSAVQAMESSEEEWDEDVETQLVIEQSLLDCTKREDSGGAPPTDQTRYTPLPCRLSL